VLGISRGSVYYKPRPVSEADLKLMHRIDKLHMEFPFAGSRMLQGLLPFLPSNSTAYQMEPFTNDRPLLATRSLGSRRQPHRSPECC
jgi:hypothetical protein